MADSFNREEFVEGYLAEAEEHLQLSGSALLRLETSLREGTPQPRLVRDLFRSLHTLKGLSAMVGIEPVVAIAHEMESILRNADRGAALSLPAIEILLNGLKAIEQRVHCFAKREVVPAPPPALLAALGELGAPVVPNAKPPILSLAPELASKLGSSEISQLAQGIAQGRRALQLTFTPSAERAARGLNITSVRERVGALGEIVKVLPGSTPKTAVSPGGLVFTLLVLTEMDDGKLAEAVDAPRETLVVIHSAPESAPVDAALEDIPEQEENLQSDTIRVSVTRLDDALEGLSALVVSRYRLARAIATLREQGVDVRELTRLLNEHGRQIRQLREALTRARMVSVAQLLERVPILVRGMSRSAGKRVQLRIDAGRAELDKGVAERIFPAILHLVRNAIDHAIETPAVREQRGKPQEGLVTIRCFERSDSKLLLTIQDDGGGIDRERVAKLAGQPVSADDAELLALITQPGLSTQEVVNDRSGRGMGMDIVRRIAVDMLGGDLSLSTRPGQGSTFTLCIPLSISILDTLSFVCGEQTFVVPMSSVEEIVDLGSASVLRAPRPAKRGPTVSMLRQRDHDIPLLELASLFALAGKRATSAMVVQRDAKRFAFAVDKMLGQQEVVIRPLEDPLVRVLGVSGTTDLGDGRPTLVLDLLSLTRVMSPSAQGARA